MSQMLRIDTLKPAPWEPKTRFSAYGMKQMVESLETYGQLIPIVVTKNGKGYDIADGHRRVEGLKLLDEDKVDAIIADMKAVDAFAEINGTSRPLRGRELTDVALAGGKLKGRGAELWNQMRQYFTMGELRKLHKLRPYSPFWFEQAKKFAIFAGTEYDDTFVWLLETGTPMNMLYAARVGKMRPATAKRIIEQNKKLMVEIVG